jgi:hypothetical protein
MEGRAPVRRRRHIGSGEYLVVLALLLLVGMFVFSTVMSATTAVTTETARVFQDRAHWNAYSGAIEAEAEAQREVPPALEDLLARAQATGEIDWSAPVLSGVEFPKLTYSYDYSSRPGCGRDDRAEVTGTITSVGPPQQLMRAGVSAGGGAEHFEHYGFALDLISTGYSSSGAKQVAHQTGTFYVDIEVVPGLTDPSSKGAGGIGDGPIVGVSSRGWPRLFAEPSSGFTLASLSGSQMRLKDLSGRWTISGGGSAFGTPWSGPPAVFRMDRLGFDSGNRPYVFYLKGLPPGTTVEQPATATILGYDGWRFSPTYVAASDTYDCGDRTAQARRYGTPRYAVVVVMAPGAGHYYPRSGAQALSQATLDLPDGSRFVLEIPSSDFSWMPQSSIIQDAGGAFVRVSGEGSYMTPPQGPIGVRAEVDWGSARAPTASNEIQLGSTQSWNIQVDGYKQDLSSSLFGSGNSRQRGPTTITLAVAVGKQSSLDLSYTGGGRTTIQTSTHGLFEPEGVSGDPVDPPPPCCDPPPPARARRWIIAYKTGTIRFLTEAPGRKLGDLGH